MKLGFMGWKFLYGIVPVLKTLSHLGAFWIFKLGMLNTLFEKLLEVEISRSFVNFACVFFILKLNF